MSYYFLLYPGLLGVVVVLFCFVLFCFFGGVIFICLCVCLSVFCLGFNYSTREINTMFILKRRNLVYD